MTDAASEDTRARNSSGVFRALATAGLVVALGTPFILRLQQTDEQMTELRRQVEDLGESIDKASRETEDLQRALHQAIDAVDAATQAAATLTKMMQEAGVEDMQVFQETIRSVTDVAAHFEGDLRDASSVVGTTVSRAKAASQTLEGTLEAANKTIRENSTSVNANLVVFADAAAEAAKRYDRANPPSATSLAGSSASLPDQDAGPHDAGDQ